MKIFCIGRNYADHAREMGSKVPGTPMVFMKPPSALLVNNKPFYIPDFTSDVHYEAEIVWRIAKNGRHVQPEFALSYIDAIAFGIDFTARDIQQQCKEKGHPWEIAKSFDSSAALSKFIPVEDVDLHNVQFSLKLNGEEVQNGNTADQIFGPREIISHISRYFKLQTGDYIYSGTPSGVGSVAIGDHIEGFIGTQSMLTCSIR